MTEESEEQSMVSNRKPRNTDDTMTRRGEKVFSCSIRRLPSTLEIEAGLEAVRQNPMNLPLLAPSPETLSTKDIVPGHIAVLTTRYFKGGAKLRVWFMENTVQDLKTKILTYMNKWSEKCNVEFTAASSREASEVRLSRGRGGYWSYLGTDILQIPKNQPTMNLEGFRLSTSDAEYNRVVCHETGHTLGCPHEHLRDEIVARIDPTKAIEYFMRTQGWSAEDVRQQVLTPLSASSIRGTPNADDTSIMCYGLPGSIMKDGRPVPGGSRINDNDYVFMATIYPKTDQPVPPPPQPSGKVWFDAGAKTYYVPADWKRVDTP